MDLRLPLLADARSHLDVAAEALDENSMITAGHELDKADEALQKLRELWPEIDAQERGLLAQLAKPLGDKLKELQARMPAAHAVRQGAAVEDLEQEMDPNSAAESE